MSAELPVIGVAGAGTMGAGIAQLARAAGARTLLHDPDPDALERGLTRIRERIDDAPEAAAALEDLAPCGLVIEAAPEDLTLKRELFARLAETVAADAVLATNTSSLPVGAVAKGVPGPERVVGMHFFNPPPVMEAVEVVAGPDTGEAALALARRVGEAMGRRVLVVADTPGFLVNRCNRPFNLEALRVVQEGLATPEQVDRLMRLGGGFRMGAFELMDLVGLDVAMAVAESFWTQSYGEPRWRPSPLAARARDAGRLGRKSGRGWYEHPPGRPRDPDVPERGGGDGLVVVAGASPLAEELRAAAAEAGWEVAYPDEAAGEVPALLVDCGALEDDPPLQGAHQLMLCDSAPLAALDPGGTAVGFHLVVPLGRAAELTAQPSTPPEAVAAATRFLRSLGMLVERVGDAPGLVLGRIVAALVNEACFALGEGIASAADVDAGMVAGLNHPRGPLEWGDAWSPEAVLAVLRGLQDEVAPDRYQPAPVLARAVRTGRALREEG